MGNFRRESYIRSQLSSITDQLQLLLDELGISDEEREDRERKLYGVIAAALEGHVENVRTERDEMYQKCVELQQNIQSILSALNDVEPAAVLSHPGLIYSEVKPPFRSLSVGLQKCYEEAEAVYSSRLMRINKVLEQFKQLAERADDMSVPAELLPINGDNMEALNLSNSRIVELERELDRWKQEIEQRVTIVAEYSARIVGLWAELGTPQAEIDSKILAHYKSNPEQLGTRKADIEALRRLGEGLENEKRTRKNKLRAYQQQLRVLWTKLGESEEYTQQFEQSNRGLAPTVLRNCEAELARLNEKKRQNIHLFIEDARVQLQALWEKLYYSEEQTYEFSPAWTDVYTDASLDAHEAEIGRLTKLIEDRKPILTLINDYYTLQQDQEALEASMHDSSRLMSKGSARRDPTRLLREEQMRKRIAKRQPKVVTDLYNALKSWEDSNGKFYIRGQYLLETIQPQYEKINLMSATRGRGRTNGPGLTNSATLSIAARSMSPAKRTAPSTLNNTLSSQKPMVKARSISPAKTRSASPPKLSRRPLHPTTTNSRPIATAKKTATPRLANLPTLRPVIRNPAPHDTPCPPAVSKPSVPQKTLSSSGSTSSENWETYDDSTSSEDELDADYLRWRKEELQKLASSKVCNSKFDWNKDVF
ncbi:hypothetical protein TRVA0_039S00298 [Trichomonascus vanleenenianus]|uniref:Ase1p n=1 Tax=Trichomonascus vanleenenianus TaxID=2268995 RepID=UPI003ECB49F2